MDSVRLLMENYWIDKAGNKLLYIKAKRELGSRRSFFTEQLGWNLIINENVIKLEKIPAHAQSYMGITEFLEIRDYCILCTMLIFLEDRETGEQFLLSELIAAVQAQLQEYMEVDWKVFVQRKSLVRVLEYAVEKGMIAVYDGNTASVASGIQNEVLYENTGLSRYFAVNFSFDISDFKSYEDFERIQMGELDENRGQIRINRVYRQLAASPAMYWSSVEDPDSLYLKNQRQWVSKYLSENIGGHLHIHRNAAFFVLDENDSFGEVHPGNAAVSEVTLNVCTQLRKLAQEGRLVRGSDDCIHVSGQEFGNVLKECKRLYSGAWSKEFREMPMEKLIRTIREHMESWMLVGIEDENIVIYPAAAKLSGVYPKEFMEKEMARNG